MISVLSLAVTTCRVARVAFSLLHVLGEQCLDHRVRSGVGPWRVARATSAMVESERPLFPDVGVLQLVEVADDLVLVDLARVALGDVLVEQREDLGVGGAVDVGAHDRR